MQPERDRSPFTKIGGVENLIIPIQCSRLNRQIFIEQKKSVIDLFKSSIFFRFPQFYGINLTSLFYFKRNNEPLRNKI